MGAIFVAVTPLLIAAEGGEANNPADYGKLTKFGVSQKEYPQLNIHELTFNDALVILKRDYWDHYRLSLINNQVIANQMFILLINMNPFNASRILQKAINICGDPSVKVIIDGVIGTETFNAVNLLQPLWLSDRIRVEAIDYYLKLTDTDNSQIVNLRSWIRRSLL